MEVIESKVQYYHNDNRDGFLSFPPSLLPEEIPGFPRETVNNVKAEDEEWARLVCERNAENIVISSLTTALRQNNTKGFIIHPYRSETYLQPLIERAKKQRRSEELLPIEIGIAKSLGLAVEKLLENINASRAVFKDLLRDNSLAKAKKKMEDDIRKYQTVNLYERNVLIGQFYQHNMQACFMEIDLIVILEESKVILNVEIKSTENCSLENSLSKAAGQLMKRNNYFSSCHGEILNKDWRFVRTVALPYATLSDDGAKVCSKCRPFILDLEVIKNMGEWTEKYLVNTKQSALLDVGQVYQKLFTRLVGFLSLSSSFLTLKDTRQLHEHKTLGTQKGISSEEFAAKETYNLENLDRKKLKGKPLSHLEVVCYWNPDQLDLVLSRPTRVLLDADFGVGKTLLMKQIAFELSKSSKETVYYISLGAARQQNMNYLTKTWLSPTVFDVATLRDFEETDVEFLSVKDLLPEDWKEKSDSNCLLNEFLLDFMTKHPNSHFFIDELPIFSKVDKKDQACSPPDLSFLRPQSQNYVWITVRPLQLDRDLFTEYDQLKEAFRRKLSSLGFVIPQLNLNMRNSNRVVQMCDSLYIKHDLKVYHDEKAVQNYLKKTENLTLTVAKVFYHLLLFEIIYFVYSPPCLTTRYLVTQPSLFQ